MRFSKTWRYLRLQNFLSREGKIVYLYLKVIETATSQNFQQLKQKYLPFLRQKMHKPDGLLVLGFLQARDRFYWPRAPDHRLISKTVCEGPGV